MAAKHARELDSDTVWIRGYRRLIWLYLLTLPVIVLATVLLQPDGGEGRPFIHGVQGEPFLLLPVGGALLIPFLLMAGWIWRHADSILAKRRASYSRWWSLYLGLSLATLGLFLHIARLGIDQAVFQAINEPYRWWSIQVGGAVIYFVLTFPFRRHRR